MRVVWLLWGKQKSLDNACHFFSHISFCKLNTLVEIFFKNLFLFTVTFFCKVKISFIQAIIWNMAWLVAPKRFFKVWMCIRVIVDLLLLVQPWALDRIGVEVPLWFCVEFWVEGAFYCYLKLLTHLEQKKLLGLVTKSYFEFAPWTYWSDFPLSSSN